MDRPFRIESGHRRCISCKERDVYRRPDSGIEYTRLWQCCNCGYALNYDVVDDECSYCFHGNSAISTYGEQWTVHESFNLNLGLQALVEDADTTSHVVCDHEPFHMADTGSFPSHQDDLASAVDQNLLRLQQFETTSDPRTTFDYDPTFDHSAMTTLNSCEGNDLDFLNTSNLDFSFENSYLENSTATKDEDMMHAVQSLSDSSDSENLWTCFETVYPDAYANLDSGYGSLLKGHSTISVSQDVEVEQPSDISQSDSLASTHCERATQEQTDFGQPRLACPFYKRDPVRCKRKACAGPGYKEIHRVLEQLKRAHIYFQCARCGKIYPGEGGEQALEIHVGLQSCEQQSIRQSIRAPWGFDHGTWERIKSRKGWKGKSREERWRMIYMALFPDTPVGSIPSPYVDCHFAVSQDLVHQFDTRRTTGQELENISRELLRLLPDRIASSMQNTINNDTALAYWNRFATQQLTAVVQQTLREIITMPNALTEDVTSVH
ncbi:hypothetical protein FB567DRAFT_315741 [Paraphoma chrysanthemicola]|uniref:C2H2-type domain-containing protein n=1 Tax=Paraphoma chrysanthemicola TaxID=798071 RepID=A0A8K0RAG1_9PLEO|nr:hypothetical protein FB567DRAFT_315741 [Paraphoma chrysanthemicola]